MATLLSELTKYQKRAAGERTASGSLIFGATFAQFVVATGVCRL